ncbi:hypothetical protein [Pseudoxanthomonas mexicana]
MPNPYRKQFKTHWIDRCLHWVGVLAIGQPEDVLGPLAINKNGSRDGFYHRPHSRTDLKDAGHHDFWKLSARHGMRIELSRRLAYVVGPGLAAVTSVAGFVVALGVK